MPHPHGQAYGYSFIPKKIQEELEGAGEYYEKTGRNLFLDLLKQEKDDGRRIIFENEYFTVYVPFFSPITYGVHVTANRPVTDLSGMTTEELNALGETIRDCAGMYDSLFDMLFPYMMCMHNAPVNSGRASGISVPCRILSSAACCGPSSSSLLHPRLAQVPGAIPTARNRRQWNCREAYRKFRNR